MFVGAFTMERFSKGCLKLKKNLHQKILRKKKKKEVLYASWTQCYKHAQDRVPTFVAGR